MVSRIATLLLSCLVLVTIGCSNSGDKGKNKDKDVPTKSTRESS